MNVLLSTYTYSQTSNCSCFTRKLMRHGEVVAPATWVIPMTANVLTAQLAFRCLIYRAYSWQTSRNIICKFIKFKFRYITKRSYLTDLRIVFLEKKIQVNLTRKRSIPTRDFTYKKFTRNYFTNKDLQEFACTNLLIQKKLTRKTFTRQEDSLRKILRKKVIECNITRCEICNRELPRT